MIQAGTSVTTAGELMKKVPVEYLHKSIMSPKKEVEALIRQLRTVKEIDYKQYSLLKKRLPFFVCGIFNPAVRKTENFAYIEYFVLDIDKLSEKGFSIENVRKTIEQDSRVRLSFVSPGEDGLKVMFKLKERCFDARIYSLFYKEFAFHFSKMYNLEQVIDRCTSDVSRACFISIDSDVYFNEKSEPINIKSFIDIDNPIVLFEKQKELVAEVKQAKAECKDIDKQVDPDKEALNNIKGILNPKLKMIRDRPAVYVPERLNEIMENLTNYIGENNIDILDIINIQYGKKMKFKLGLMHAEINLFYGKKGFSTVISPKSGTSADFNDTMAKLIDCFLYENQLD